VLVGALMRPGRYLLVTVYVRVREDTESLGAAISSTSQQAVTHAKPFPLRNCPDSGRAVTNHRHVRCDPVHCRRPCVDARDQGPAWSSDRDPEASANGVGQGQPQHGLRPRAVPAGNPAKARIRATCRHHGGGRVFQGVRIRLSAGRADTAVSTWPALGALVGVAVI
jgi:hypothetical protein